MDFQQLHIKDSYGISEWNCLLIQMVSRYIYKGGVLYTGYNGINI